MLTLPAIPPRAHAVQPIAGWLRLFVASAWLAVLRHALVLLGIAAAVADGRHASRTTPGAPHYDELWEPLTELAAISQTALLVIGLFLLSFIALRRAMARNYAIGWLILDAIFGTTIYLLAQQIPAVAATPDVAAAALALLAVLPLAWIPYLTLSRRVRETLVT